MREMNLNTEKQIMPDREEVETVDSAEEVIGINISISSSSNLRTRNSVGKLPECQPRCATPAGGLASMRTSAAFVLRHFAHSARPKVTFYQPARERPTMVVVQVGELGDLGVLEVKEEVQIRGCFECERRRQATR